MYIYVTIFYPSELSLDFIKFSANTPCLLSEDPADETKFITANNVTMSCPVGQVWKQEYCTCVRGM